MAVFSIKKKKRTLIMRRFCVSLLSILGTMTSAAEKISLKQENKSHRQLLISYLRTYGM